MESRDNIRFTRHGIRQHSKRFGMHGETRNVNQIRADVRDGYLAADFTGRERRWLLSKEWAGCYAVVSRDKCIILNPNDAVVTVYPLPAWFGIRQPLYAGKQRVRNAGVYRREFVPDAEYGF